MAAYPAAKPAPPAPASRRLSDLAPDLGAVGHAARVSKGATTPPQELVSFSVRKGDNGGLVVNESYEKKAPEGRRASSFLLGGDSKENVFGAKDGAAATSHITGLLGQMGVQGAGPAEPGMPAEDLGGGDMGMPPGPPPPPPRPAPALSAIAGPRGAAMTGPRGGGAARLGPPPSFAG